MARDNPVDDVVKVLEAAGVSFRLEHGTKHVKVLFEVRGRRLMHVCSCTSSDHRARLNAVADVRRKVRGVWR